MSEEIIQKWKKDKRRKLSSVEKREFCAGCRQNFYNGNNDLGVKECWSLKSAKLKEREIYRSLDSVEPDKVITLDCYTKQYH